MYTQVGFCTFTEIRVVSHAFLRLDALIADQQQAIDRVSELFTKAQIDPIKAKNYDFGMMKMMRFATAAQGDDTLLAVYRLMHVLLAQCGRAPAMPPVEYYRVDPSMSIAEAIWQVGLSYIDLTKVKGYLPPDSIPIVAADIGDALYQMINDMRRWKEMLPILESRFKIFIKHIIYKIKMALPIDSFEKTVLLHARDPIYGTEISVDQPAEANTLASTLLKDAAENADPLVSMFVDKLKQACLPGPKFSFWPLISNMRPEALFAYFGPYSGKAVLAAGWFAKYAQYTALKLKPMALPITVTPQEHLLGILSTSTAPLKDVASRAIGLKSGIGSLEGLLKWVLDRPIVERQTVFTGKMTKMITSIILDIPEVELIWHNDNVSYRYHSDVLGRTVTTGDETAPLFEIARKTQQYGGTASFKSSIDELELADIAYLVAAEKIVNLGDLKMPVIYQSLVNGEVQTTVDLRPFFSQYGDKLVKPAFSEFFKTPVTLLEVPQPSAVDWIAQDIGLNEFETLMSRRALTICYNGFILERVFSKLPQIGVNVAPNSSDLIKYAATALFSRG